MFCFFFGGISHSSLCHIADDFAFKELMVNTSRAQNPECLVSGYETGLRVRCKQSTLIVYLLSQDDKLGGSMREVSFCVYAYLDSISKSAIM